MLKEALQYLVGLAQPTEIEHAGVQWTSRNLGPIGQWNPEPLVVPSLQGLADLSKEDALAANKSDCLLVVHSPGLVGLYLQGYGAKSERVKLAEAKLEGARGFPYAQWMAPEDFVITAMTRFMLADDLMTMVSYAGKLTGETATALSDDGVAQLAEIRQGVTSRAVSVVRNPVTLRPWRTFVDIQQPASPFVFRVRGGGGTPIQCALFECDGPVWRDEAERGLREYLKGVISKKIAVI